MPGYKGPLFRTVFIDRKLPKSAKSTEIRFWGKIFSDLSLAPSYGEGSHGNMSFRFHKGCIITATRTDLKNLDEGDFVEIVDCVKEKNEMIVYCKGKREPSTDSFIHFLIYQERPDIQCILHGHDDLVLEKAAALKISQTESEKESGSLELFREIKRALGRRNYLIVKNHGILSFGRTVREAGDRALRVHERAMRKPLPPSDPKTPLDKKTRRK